MKTITADPPKPWFGVWNGFLLLMPPCPWPLSGASLLSFYFCPIWKSYMGDLWYRLPKMHFGVRSFRNIAFFPSYITKDKLPADFFADATPSASTDVTPVVVPDSLNFSITRLNPYLGDNMALRILGYERGIDDSPVGKFHAQFDRAARAFIVKDKRAKG